MGLRIPFGRAEYQRGVSACFCAVLACALVDLRNKAPRLRQRDAMATAIDECGTAATSHVFGSLG